MTREIFIALVAGIAIGAARLLLDQHGPLAVERACDRIQELCSVGDMRGCALWSRVAAAINELGRTEGCRGEPVS